MSTEVFELAEQIKDRGQRATAEVPALLQKAEALAQDDNQGLLTRALAWRAAGNALQILNQFQAALERYDRAVALLERDGETFELGRTLHAKVGLLFSLSRFDELFVCSAQARTIFEQSGDRRRLARLDVNLAHAYHRMGRHVEALDCSERALPVLQEMQDAEGLVAASINSGVTLTAMHEFERAEERYRAAMQVAEAQQMASWVLLSRFNLAYLLYLGGDTARALHQFASVRKEYEKANDEWLVCQCWLDEAEILLEVGDLNECIESSRRARVIGEKLGLNTEVGRSLLFEAVASFRDGLDKHAAELLSAATVRFAKDGNNVLAAMSVLQTAMFRGEGGDAMALVEASSARALLRNSGLPHRLALADIVIGRIQRTLGDHGSAVDSFKSGLAFAEGSRSQWMQFHALYELGLSLAAQSPSEGERCFRRAEGMLDSLWTRLGSDELKMAFLADRENVYTQLVRVTVRDMPETAFGFSEKARSRVLRERLITGVEQPSHTIRSQLSPEETIVEYFTAGDDLYIFVVRRDSFVSVQRPGVVKRLVAECAQLDRHLSSCSVKWERLAAVGQHLQTTCLQHLHVLYRELIAPVESSIHGTVIFVPYGFLHNVPLHALYNGESFVAENHAVAYSPSAALYCSAAGRSTACDALFIAFSKESRSSVEEVENAAAHFANSTVLVNPSLEDLRDALDAPRSLIHIAGHAGIDSIGGKLSWIQTSAGRITSRDLMDMHLRAKTLVVTGCQTARRAIQPGDEWLGLMRSLYLAGANTIVTAFWDIRDESARRFAAEFYRNFDGDNAPVAVRNASASMRGWRSHPYFWAGFGAFVRKSN